MVLVVPCSKIYPHIAPSEGRIISLRENNINIFYKLIYITINILICCVAVTVTSSVSMVTLN